MPQPRKCGSAFVHYLPALSALHNIHTCKSNRDDTSSVSHCDQAMTAIKYAASMYFVFWLGEMGLYLASVLKFMHDVFQESNIIIH